MNNCPVPDSFKAELQLHALTKRLVEKKKEISLLRNKMTKCDTLTQNELNLALKEHSALIDAMKPLITIVGQKRSDEIANEVVRLFG